MTQELKGCPFCGASPKLVQHTATLWSVECDDCNAGSGWAEDIHSPVSAWNRRAPDARDARIAELEAELAAEPRATDAPTAVAAADPQLLKFYGAASDAELIAAQAAHIKRLQAKLPPAPSFAPQRVREG